MRVIAVARQNLYGLPAFERPERPVAGILGLVQSEDQLVGDIPGFSRNNQRRKHHDDKHKTHIQPPLNA